MDLRKKYNILPRARLKFNRLLPYLNKPESILDIGTGNGGLAFLLQEAGFKITASDKIDKTYFNEIAPTIAPGERLPFPDNSFDCVMMITMLHHTDDPELVLKEAVRVAKTRIIIMEDIYRTLLQQYLTYALDSIVNWEFAGHPHSNKSKDQWKALYEKYGLKIVIEKEYSTAIFFRQITVVLEI